MAGTLETVLCCWEKTEEGELRDQHLMHTRLHLDVQPLPLSAGAATMPQKRGPASGMSLTSALVVSKKKLGQLLPPPATQPRAPSFPPFLCSPYQNVTPRTHLHPFPSSQEKAIPNRGGYGVLTSDTGVMGMSPAPIGQGISSARSCLAEGTRSRWVLQCGALEAEVTFPAPGDS